MERKPTIAILGGSGLYEMPGLQDTVEYDIDTVFGKPSAPIIVGTLEGVRVAFLARHGIGHHLTPTGVNYRANIYALKTLGVEQVISVSACGSLRDDYAPGDIVVPDQLYDNTKDRERSFFENGLVSHIGVADPFCPDLSEQIYESVKATGAVVHKGGTTISIEGPRFSTRGESNTYRTWGMSLVNMTSAPEAFLAREAEMCYAVMNHVTDYDVWHVTEEPVTVEMVIATLNKNTGIAQTAIRNLVSNRKETRTCECSSALSAALITNPDVIPDDTRKKLSLLVDKYLP